MASKEDMERALKAVGAKLDDPAVKPRFAGYSKTLQFTFPDINTSFVVRVKNGSIESLTEESLPTPDVQVTVASDLFLNIVNKKASLLLSYQTGKLKAKGAMPDLLKLQKLL